MLIRGINSTPMDVTSDNRGKVSSVSEPLDTHINHYDGKVWSVSFFDVNPVGANDYFFYFKNTGTAEIAITDFRMSATTTASRIYINSVSGTPTFTAGTDLTPVSRNIGKPATMSATIKSDTDTTGLTNDGTLFHMELDTVNKLFHLSTSSKLIIPQGKAIAIQWVEATGEVSGVVSFIEIPGPTEI
jgi:hypothetical protein